MRGEENRKRWMRRYWAYRKEKGLAAEVSLNLRPLDTALIHWIHMYDLLVSVSLR